MDVLKKPKQCQNGHIFCNDCILDSIKLKPECPICKVSLTAALLGRNLLAEQHLASLKVFCRNRFKDHELTIDEDGCKEIITLEDRDKHEKICPFSLEFCRFSAVVCPKVRKKDKEQHEHTCDYRLVPCTNCREEVQAIRLSDHLSMCGMVQVPCEKCGVTVARKALIPHWETDCPEHKICCQFAEDGCTFKGERKLYLAHLRDEIASHMSLLKESCNSKISSVRAEYEKQLLTQDERIALLERLVDDYDTEVRWVLRSWSTVKKRSFLQSERFPIAGCNFYLGAYPDGDGEDSKGFFSLYLFLDLPYSTKHRVSLRFALRVVNHRDPFISVKKVFRATFPIGDGQGWGDRHFIPTVQLTEQSGLLHQDTLVLEVGLLPRKSLWTLSTLEK